jgi:excisionase family DNA binding protein
MSLADEILDLVRPQLVEIVDALVEERLARFEPPPPEPWMTAKEAAVYLSTSVTAIRQKAQRGTVPAHKDEGRWLFHREELDEYIRY